jgi:hypothetical protein
MRTSSLIPPAAGGCEGRKASGRASGRRTHRSKDATAVLQSRTKAAWRLLCIPRPQHTANSSPSSRAAEM